MLSIDIAIATHGESGIGKVEKILLQPVENVRYIVSWQEHENLNIPESINNREDVEVYRFDEKGLSKNRNNAIENCRSDIIVIADDDITYLEGFYDEVTKVFTEDSSLDFAIFKYDNCEGKIYPDYDCLIKLPFPKNYYGSSIEFAIRRKSLADLRFNPELGLGAPFFQSGEDEFLLISAIKRGLNVKFINKEICRHVGKTTGSKPEKGVLRSMGFIIRLMYPKDFLLRLILKAYRIGGQGNVGMFEALISLLRGSIGAKRRVKKMAVKYRW